MSKIEIKSLLKEQKICITCGLCCDGTLFRTAGLDAVEKGNLPEKIEQNYFKNEDKEYFRLPCPYFNDKCTIYYKKKAFVCSTYRCQLLKDFADKKITMEDSLEVVRKAKKIRAELIEKYHKISGNYKNINFRQILIEIGKYQKNVQGHETPSMDYEMFVAHCNIFEALLIKHFRSSTDFNNMMK